MQALRVLLQEGDDEFRNEIKAALAETDVFILSHACKSFQLLTERFFYYLPDVLIFNWQYNTPALFNFINNARTKLPHLKIIVTFDFAQPDFVFQLQQLGVEQCLLKPFLIKELLRNDLQPVISNKFNFHVNMLHRHNKIMYGN